MPTIERISFSRTDGILEKGAEVVRWDNNLLMKMAHKQWF